MASSWIQVHRSAWRVRTPSSRSHLAQQRMYLAPLLRLLSYKVRIKSCTGQFTAMQGSEPGIRKTQRLHLQDPILDNPYSASCSALVLLPGLLDVCLRTLGTSLRPQRLHELGVVLKAARCSCQMGPVSTCYRFCLDSSSLRSIQDRFAGKETNIVSGSASIPQRTRVP